MSAPQAPDATGADAHAAQPPRSLHEVPGWFYNTDLILFDLLLDRQRRLQHRGDMLEMGAYLGKSAVLLGAYLRPEETFTVCDLFGDPAPTEHNSRETERSYATLTRRGFEANYLAFHEELPRILHAPTSVVPREVPAESCRFVHVDASHLYEHVRDDLAATRDVLGGAGVAVLDDYRSGHTPGVACATWEAVLGGGLRPICASPHKFYGTWGDPAPLQEELYERLSERGRCWLQWQDVAGQRLLLVAAKDSAPPPLPSPRCAPGRETPGGPASAVRASRARVPAGLRRTAVDWLPPAVVRGLVRVRGRARG
ncbi:class I SAM-dependent methyltransferase [Streptomyces xiaopingdaonensis]|uniref:class I SAM-dependent methyltransferase n=1 Tax=Streptomyces xiaopingdaonensis TaxID=1565415 RepID=UPI0002E82806|nr:class I SAM-dependent methyltransferase [Streptomyces xiaopingdaonensis]